jgi:uncharacterized protein
MPEISSGVAAITGASSGLGAVFARKLAARGWNLLLIARRQNRLNEVKEKLETAYPVTIDLLVADLADDSSCQYVATRLESLPDLGILVNNAGFGTKGVFWETDLDRQLEMYRLHVMATVRLTRAVLPRMVQRDSGAIINVSSVAAFARTPGNTSYCSTKGWMNDFTEGLHLELRVKGSRVIIQALCPGFTHTEFHDTLGVSRSSVPKSLWLDADFVVDESLRCLKNGKVFVVPDLRYRAFSSIVSRIPSSWRMSLGSWSPHTKDRR